MLNKQSTRKGRQSTMSHGTAQAYGEPWYWNNRYAQETGPFDWYQTYSSLRPLLDLYISRHQRILVTGCGNSALGEGMVNDGYEDVVNVDISSVVIEAMQKKYQDLPQLKYIEMDVRDMSSFQTGSFDAVLDKGTLDSIMCGSNSRVNVTKMLKEIGRVLNDKGVYIMITYGSPPYRLPFLKESCGWTIKLHVIEKLQTSEDSKRVTLNITEALPLEEDGGSIKDALGKSSDVHYIYICAKDDSFAQSSQPSTGSS